MADSTVFDKICDMFAQPTRRERARALRHSMFMLDERRNRHVRRGRALPFAEFVKGVENGRFVSLKNGQAERGGIILDTEPSRIITGDPLYFLMPNQDARKPRSGVVLVIDGINKKQQSIACHVWQNPAVRVDISAYRLNNGEISIIGLVLSDETGYRITGRPKSGMENQIYRNSFCWNQHPLRRCK